jgi:Flp pilus assembly protein TadD
MSPNDPDLWNFKAVVLRSMGRHEEAIECFNKSLKIDPRDKNAS